MTSRTIMIPERKHTERAQYVFFTLLVLLSGTLLMSAGNKNADTTSFGIDVSRHNGKIDWNTVRTHYKLQFVYVKATEGATYSDPCFQQNIKGAIKSGFPVGAYHYFRMTSSAHAQFVNFVKVAGKMPHDLIPMVDVETTDKHSVKETQDSLRVFINLVKSHFGKAPMIYATNRSYNEICGAGFKNYHLYIGRYGKKEPAISGKGRYTIWQYSEKGKLKGIPKPVDLARFNSRYSINSIRL